MSFYFQTSSIFRNDGATGAKGCAASREDPLGRSEATQRALDDDAAARPCHGLALGNGEVPHARLAPRPSRRVPAKPENSGRANLWNNIKMTHKCTNRPLGEISVGQRRTVAAAAVAAAAPRDTKKRGGSTTSTHAP